MKFNDLLNKYITEIGCTAKELSEVSGLSAAALSRYRTGERVPGKEQLAMLIDGLVSLAEKNARSERKEPADVSEAGREIREAFKRYTDEADFDYEQFTANLNTLISAFDISTSELSRALSFDPSYISRIRLGQRRPSDREGFIEGICRFVVNKKYSEDTARMLAELTGCSEDDLTTDSGCMDVLREWLSSGTSGGSDPVGSFLRKFDDFDLDEYIRAIKFDQLKVPSLPFQLPVSRNYYGIEEMKQGELDFFKTTVLSKSLDDVFMCSDMPMADMAEDLDFGKKWMFGIAMMMKKGLHINIIHNIDRPFGEMMLGLESWMPLYMTGQVSPYYLRGKHNGVYCHFNYVSGKAALSGECIQGHHDSGRYCLTKNREEVAYFSKKAKQLLSKARPLMEVYRSESAKQYSVFINTDASVPGPRHNILSSLPLYTMNDELLERLFDSNDVTAADRVRISAFAQKQKELVENMIQENTMTDDVPLLTEEEFAEHPMVMSLSDIFYEKELYYSYEEYRMHLEACRDFAEKHKSYRLNEHEDHAFRNIQIRMHEGSWAMVSKNKAPAVHFVIRHPKMLDALENFVAPVSEAVHV